MLFLPALAPAQAIDLGGHIGFYIPLGAMVEDASVQKRLQTAPIVGADVMAWPTKHLGFAGNVAWAPAKVAVSAGGQVVDEGSNVILASARLLYAFMPIQLGRPGPGGRGDPWSLYIGAGGGLASRSGAVWSYSSGLTSAALVLSLGTKTANSAWGVVGLELSDYISHAQFDAGTPTETASRVHHDLVIAVSFAYRVLR